MSAARFFRTGGTLQPDAPSYVVRDADAGLLQAVRNAELCYILTSRQMGKSSLMARTAAQLRREGKTAPVLLDLSGLGKNLTPEQWYAGLLSGLGQIRVDGRSLGLEDALWEHYADEARRGLGPYQRWARAVEQVLLPRCPLPIVVFIDEIDAVLSLPFPADELFAGIRELYNRRVEDPRLARLTFCLAGVATPSDLIRDVGSTPFNVGRAIVLEDFTEAEAMGLARGLGEDGEAALRRVLHWTGGHPYLTQRLCQALAESGATRDVDAAVSALFFTQTARERDDNLSVIRNRLLASDADTAGLLDLYDLVLRGKPVVDDGLQPLAATLRLSGIVRRDDAGRLHPRNPIYRTVFDRRWVRESLPDAEIERQKRAFRRGLLRASLAFSGVIAGSSAATWWALHRRAERQARLAEFLAQMNIAGQAYAAGNLERARQILGRYKDQPEFRSRAEWGLLSGLCREQARRIPDLPDEPIALHIDAARQEVWAIGGRGELARRSLKDGAALPAPERIARSGLACAAFSGDGTYVALSGGDAVRLVETATGRVRWQTTLSATGAAAYNVACSENGDGVAAGDADGAVHLLNATTGARRATLTDNMVGAWVVAFSRDSRILAVGDGSGVVRLWDIAALHATPRRLPLGRTILGLRFSPDNRELLVIVRGAPPSLWEIETGVVRNLPAHHDGQCLTGDFSGDGRRLVTAGEGLSLAVWGRRRLGLLRQLRGGQSRQIVQARFVDPQTVFTLSRDGEGCLWPAPALGAEVDAFSATVTADGALAYTVCWRGKIRRIALSTGEETIVPLEAPRNPQHSPERLALLPGDRVLAVGSSDGTITLWDCDANTVLRRSPPRPESSPAFSSTLIFLKPTPRGDRILACWPDGTLDCLRTDTLTPAWSVALEERLPYQIAIRPDGGELALSVIRESSRPVIRDPIPLQFRDMHTGALRRTRSFSADAVGVCWRRDGRQFVVRMASGSIAWLDADGNQVLPERMGHFGGVTHACFSADGRTLATTGSDSVVRLWDTETGQETLELSEIPGPYVAMEFTADGRALTLVTAQNRALRLSIDA